MRVLDLGTRELMEHYKSTLNWWQDEYNFSGRKVKSPRLISLMGDKDYTYSGVEHKAAPWDSETTALKDLCYDRFGFGNYNHNGVLFNHYRDGKDSISPHSDKEDGIDLSVPIMSINLGQTRTFYIQAGNDVFSVPLADGDGILMIGLFQQECKHWVPKEPKCKGERINLTFRKFW